MDIKYCDRCGKEVKEIPIFFGQTFFASYIWNEDVVLCTKCRKSFKKWMKEEKEE